MNDPLTFFSRLETRAREIDSLLCIGLDPHPYDLTEQSGQAAKAFCVNIIEATADFATAYKPNSAFFEVLGPEGIAALISVIEDIPREIPVILDAKRGDISSTANAYAQAVFQTLGADAVTVNPYLGLDAVKPFIENPEKGVFLLCKTSNQGAADLQDLIVISPRQTHQSDLLMRASDSTPTYLHIRVAELAQAWNQQDNLGLVVGATQPESLARVRASAPDLWILAPGVGAQGGNVRSALQAGLRQDGLGMLIPVSRGISRADNPRQAARDLMETINRERQQALHVTEGDQGILPPEKVRIADGLLAAGCVKFGSFILKSGAESPIYIDLRRLVGYPRLLSEVSQAYIKILRSLHFDHLAALPYAALPIASAVSLDGDWSMVYPRKEVKSYGTRAQIEGVFQPGDQVVVIDDLISTGGSKFEGIDKLKSSGLVVNDVVVLIDRSPDGGVELSRQGFRLHAVLTLNHLLDYYSKVGQVPLDKIQATRDYLAGKYP